MACFLSPKGRTIQGGQQWEQRGIFRLQEIDKSKLRLDLVHDIDNKPAPGRALKERRGLTA
jgi:hypothetical protein